jgi:ElaB/YqjD/DUF883 family membrane-anchored ribosome-binding protein
MNAPDEPAPDEIRTEIERTREEMSETLGEIQERLRPNHLLQQAKESVSDAASTKARQIMHTAGDTAQGMADQAQSAGRQTMYYARTHPTQMALIAGGLTWWLLHRAERNGERRWNLRSDGWRSPGFSGGTEGRYRTGPYREGRDYSQGREYGQGDGYGERRAYGEGLEYGEGQAYAEAREYTEGSYASGTTESGEGFASSVRETASEYADSARQGARQVSDRVRRAASDASWRTRERWDRASTSVDRWVHENPLAAGALALAAGLATGLTAPRTHFEDRTMGETRDQAMESATRTAHELKDTVTQKVQDVAGSVMGGGDDQQRTGSNPGTGSTQGSNPGTGGDSA